MADQDPVEKLVFALLLVSLKKQAEAIRIRADEDELVVHFTIDGVQHEEMRPPLALRRRLFAMLAEMASLPIPESGRVEDGFITIMLGDGRHERFAISLRTHGAVQLAELHALA